MKVETQYDEEWSSEICKTIYDNQSFTPSGVVLTSSNTRNLIHSEQHQGMLIRRDYASHTIRNRCYSKRWTNSSFGKIVPSKKLCKFLKTSMEFNENKSVIQRNTDIVQKETNNLRTVVLMGLSGTHAFLCRILDR